jgi:hypothetical protein
VNRLISTLCALLFTALPIHAQQNHLGFDKNVYPGDNLLPALHKAFEYTSYWLNSPPGMSINPWTGKRNTIRTAGFGFLILYNGRLDAELKGKAPAALGKADANNAALRAKQEGFPPRAIIFLDQEEGGRLLLEQAAYIGAWFRQLANSGYEPGIYCSGIATGEGKDRISTAEDVARKFPKVKLWVANDQCPPAPGCVMHVSDPSRSGIANTLVWQFAQSPRRPFAEACKQTYAGDNNCYAPEIKPSSNTFLDLNTSSSADPSRGR